MMARGVFGQLIYADPERELVVVILSSWPEFTSIERAITALNLVDAFAGRLRSTDVAGRLPGDGSAC